MTGEGGRVIHMSSHQKNSTETTTDKETTIITISEANDMCIPVTLFFVHWNEYNQLIILGDSTQ